LKQRPISPTDEDRVAAGTWAGFAMMCVGMFMAILDVQVAAIRRKSLARPTYWFNS
jgi:hypothetical protein